MLRIEKKKKWTVVCIKGKSLALPWQSYLTSIFFVGNLKESLGSEQGRFVTHENHQTIFLWDVERDWNILGAKLIYQKTKTNYFCGILKEIGIFLGQNWYIKLHQCSVIGNIYSQRILGNLEFLHKKISSIVWNCKRKKESYFQYKISNVRPYIHNLSAMKLTNCVEIKLSAPPTAKGGLQLLFNV